MSPFRPALRLSAVALITPAAALPAAALPAAEFHIADAAEFARCVPAGAKLEKLAGAFSFIEGPVWITVRRHGGHAEDREAREADALPGR